MIKRILACKTKPQTILVIAVFLFLNISFAEGATFTATSNGNWNNGATWGNASPGVAGIDFPGSTDNAVISTNWSLTVTLQANTTCVSITIQNNGNLFLNNFNFTSTGISILTNQARITGTGSAGTKTLSLGSGINLSDFNSSISTTGYDITISGNLALTNQGFLSIGANNLTVAGDFSCDGTNTYIAWTDGNVNIGGNISYNYSWSTIGFNCTGTGWLIMTGTSKTFTANSNVNIARFKQPIIGFVKSGGSTITISNIFDQNCGPSAPSGVSVLVPGNTINSSCSPTLIVSPTSLSAFSYCLGSGPSASQSITIIGSSLTGSGNIMVTGSTNYLVSTDNSTFNTTAVYPFAAGIITGQPKTVYVRLKAGLAIGNYNSENITFSGGGLVSPPIITNNGTIYSIPGAPSTTGAIICIGTTTGTTLSASGAVAGDKYRWYDASSGGTLLKTSANDVDNSYITPSIGATTNYWVSIQNAGNCESPRTLVTATYTAVSGDNQSIEGANSWIGHIYDGTNSGVAFNGSFTNYFGLYSTVTETLDEQFGGNTNCFLFTSSLGNRSIYTETFSVRYRMNSARKGIYVADLGSDDGGRLSVDGTLVYNNWVDQSFSSKTRVLFNLTGNSSLVYDYYENGGGNRVVFTNFVQVLPNSLSTNTTQNICIGFAGTAISGDTYGALPAGITLSETGYQWTYSTMPAGIRTNIAGATGATYTPDASIAPLNAPGTYYIYRNAVVSSSNNVSPNPFVATNESNAATITINPNNTASLSSAVGSDNQITCISTAITNITYSTTIATGATITGLPAGVTGVWAANTVTISGTPTASGTFNYAVTLTSGCGVISATGILTVNPNNTIVLSSAASTNNQTICISTALTPITYTTTGASGATVTGLPAGVNGSWSANTVTISGTPTVSGTFNYTVTLTGGCGVISTTGILTVNPNNTIVLSSAASTNNQTICISTAITTITYTTTRANGATVTGLPAGINGIWSANTVTINGTPTASGTFNYTVTLTGGCGTITATGTISATPAVGTPVFALGTTSTRFQSASTATYTATATNTTGITYSLDATNIAAGNTIVAATGSVSFTAGWTGISTITAKAAGCSGLKNSTHTVTTSLAITYYSYQTGNWNDPNTWTFDPGGTTGPVTTIPGNNDIVFILQDRTVTLTADVATTNLDVSILAGGIMDEATFKFTNTITSLRGGGTLQLSSASFPVVSNNTFVTSDGGTTEYRTTGAFDLPAVQTTYYHLTINNTSETARQINDLVINGDLHVKKGIFQINDATATRRQLTIKGNVSVDITASITLGGGNTVTGLDAPLTVIDGGIAPFLNYYNNETHKVIIQGDFINNGTVRFTNQAAPKYDAFSNTGAATVYFQGNSDNLLTCNGQTDFYNLIVDKGLDQTYKLTVYSNAYSNFRLFGANNAPSANSALANPGLKKALWVRNGTMVLQGLTVIPSLSEGTTTVAPNTANYIIPANGSLVLDGTGVIVLSTADDYTEVQAAYNLSGGSNTLYGINNGSGSESGLSILGKLQVNNGYLSTRESAGLLYWSNASGQFVLNNGTVDTKQFHNPEGGTNGLVTYMQTGGHLILRGRFQNTINYATADALGSPIINTVRAANSIDGNVGLGTMHISANASNGFVMTGGTMSIYDVPGTTATSYAFLVNSPVSNFNVTGGTVQFVPTAGTALADANYLVNSLAPFGNIVVNRVSSTSIVQLITYPLTVLQNVSLTSGVFDANSFDVSVGGNFTIASGTTYTTGTNSTVFNGTGTQTFNVNLAGALSLSTLKINKAATDILAFAGTQSIINTAAISITGGKLDDNGNTINVSGNIYNAGTHFSTPGSGKIVMNGTTTQTITGNNAGVFNNLDLNNTSVSTAPITLAEDFTITGALSLVSDKVFLIGSSSLRLLSSASISSTPGFSNSCFIQTNGQAGDGGITKTYSSNAAFTFPVGTFSTKRPATYAYTPATIGFIISPAIYGSVTVVPVGYEHPVTSIKNQSLTYFWRVKSSGFSGIVANSVTHSFNYSQTDVNGTEANYIPALFTSANNTWNKGNNANPPINTITNIFTDWFIPTQSNNFLDADYTAGDNAFTAPQIFYSRNGGGNWNLATTWSTDQVLKHDGVAAATFPGLTDIVIIAKNSALFSSTVTLTQVHSCASLKIETGSVLDIRSFSGSYFGLVGNHPNGNGLFRLTTTATTANVPKIFAFPTGDFSQFNSNSGTTEFYDSDGTVGALYILPSNVTLYGNLMVTAKGGDNLVFPNNFLTTIQGDLTCGGDNANAWIAVSWNTSTAPYNSGLYNPTIEKTIHVTGNLNINTGTLIFMPENIPQHLVIDGNVTVGASGYIETQPAIYGTPNGAPQTNTLSIGGNLINNSNGAPYVRFRNGTYYCDVSFTGSANTTVSGISPQTIFNNVTVNKGTSQASTLTMSIGGTLSTLTDNWLNLINGTFIYNRTGNLNLATGTPFSIPASAGLTLDNTASNITIGTNTISGTILSLSGKLKLTSNFIGNVLIGTNGVTVGNHNDIQYSSGGASSIEIAKGNLIVNGQIRRDPSNAAGILSYTQTGGTVTIVGNAVAVAPSNINNAKLEVLNDGSQFTMSGGVLNIVRAGGGNTFGDLYLRPTSGSVTGGTINFAPGTNGNQSFQVDANIPLNNLTLTGSASNVPTLKLMVSPLILNGNCIIGTNTVFNTNNINTTFNGNFTNNVGLTGYLAGTNLTTFSASNSSSYLGVQSLGGGATNFYNLLVNPGASLTLNNPCSVLNNLSINSGTLILASNLLQVTRNFGNNGRYTDANIANTGIRLMGSASQHISGAGNFGRLEINNIAGAQLDNSIYMEEDLVLTTGILDINEYLLSLGLNSKIPGSSFSAAKMIKTDGVFSSLGIRKLFPAGASAAFLYPLGTAGKYTPATLTISVSNTVGYVQINNINQRHPAVIDPANALDYYWGVTSSGITGLTGNIIFNYLQSDVKGAQENSYMAARLIVPGTSWSLTSTNNATTNAITFNHTASNNLGGEYTTGISTAFPPDVPVYTSNKNGNWTDKTIWTQTGGTTYPCPAGGPNGFIVIINHEITANSNYCQAYRTTINNKLKIVSPYFGHNLGKVDGDGTLYLEIGSFPAGVFTEFLDCANNATIEYGGIGTYTIVADLYNSIPKLLVSGSGTRILPAKDLTICKSLKINGPKLDNSISNRKLTIQGTMEIVSGAFNSGSGSNATVSFEGSGIQTIGGSLGNFTGANAFNNFEINNSSGLTVNTGGAIEVNGELRLSNGLINTNPDAPNNYGTLTITNPAITCVIPTGGTSSSFVNGPLSKKINQGDNFLYPIGIYKSGSGNTAGNKLSLSSTKSGTIVWTASYYNPNPTFASYTAPIKGVSSKEFWNVKAMAGSKAIININWDPQSDITPLVTQNGLNDMIISTYQAGNWVHIKSDAAGDDYNGTTSTYSMATSTGSDNYTLAALSTLRPKAKLDPLGPTCGTAGIPVSFVSQLTMSLNYTLNYTIDGVAQPQIVVSALPYSLPTPVPGVYKLTAFTYNNDLGTGVVDASSITVNADPTVSDAGIDQALCGITSAYLNANPLGITSGTGLWSIISGNGGTLITPISRTSQFIGLNGTSYKLRWTISNGSCKSTDDVIINFNLVPLAPAASANQTICANSTIADIQVTPPSGSTVSWFSAASGGSALLPTQILVSGDYYAESNGGTGCQSLSRIKVTVTVIPMVWSGSESTNWNVAGNWSCGSLPNTNSNVQIPNVANKPVLSSGVTGAVKNIVIDASSSVTVTGNTLQIAGTITNNGTFTATTGTIEMRGTVAQTIVSGVFAGNTIQGLTINNLAGVSLSGPLNVTGVVYAPKGDLASGGNLTLISTAAQTALIDGTSIGKVNGNVTMQRYLPSGFGYKYVSSPFQSAKVSELADDINLAASFPTLYKYDEDNHRDSSGVSIYNTGWAQYLTTTNLLTPMQGYAANFGNLAAAKTFNISGVVNDILTTQTLYNHNRPYTKGFNLAGNPYPSPIDWNAATGWTKTNIDNALYFFDNGIADQYTGTYSSYVNGVSTGTGGSIIPSMQGFFIHVSNGTYPVSASLGMDNRVRVNNLSPTYHKSAIAQNQPLVRINAAFEKETKADPAVIYFDESATENFDTYLDALKLMNTDISVPNLYVIANQTEQLSISAMPYPIDSITKIPLGIKTEQSNWVTFTATNIENLPSDLKVYFSDGATGVVQDLRFIPTYRVNLQKGTIDKRFALLFSYKSLSSTLNDKNSFYANIANGKLNIFVNLAAAIESRITISNVLGQVMMQKNLYGNGLHEIDTQLPGGIYILTLHSQQGMSSLKIYIPK